MISNLIFKKKCIEYLKECKFFYNEYEEKYFKTHNWLIIEIKFDKFNLPKYIIKDIRVKTKSFYYNDLEHMLAIINLYKNEIDKLIEKYYIWDI